MNNRGVQAIVLAGGKGTRMKSDLPKVLFDLYGKSVIRHSIDNVREAGIGDVIVVVGYRRDLVMEHLGEGVRFAVQEEQLGTGHAALQALPLLEKAAGPVVICYGDMPFVRPATFRALVQASSASNRLLIGSSATTAAAGSATTSTSSMAPLHH